VAEAPHGSRHPLGAVGDSEQDRREDSERPIDREEEEEDEGNANDDPGDEPLTLVHPAPAPPPLAGDRSPAVVPRIAIFLDAAGLCHQCPTW
jgi:hypothetical protein